MCSMTVEIARGHKWDLPQDLTPFEIDSSHQRYVPDLRMSSTDIFWNIKDICDKYGIKEGRKACDALLQRDLSGQNTIRIPKLEDVFNYYHGLSEGNRAGYNWMIKFGWEMKGACLRHLANESANFGEKLIYGIRALPYSLHPVFGGGPHLADTL